jgi:hypothetical protein
MPENNKRTSISSDRWVFILEYLINNEAHIRSMLQSAVTRNMPRAEVFLENITEGNLELSAITDLPENGNRLHIWSVPRPTLSYPKRLQQEIENLSFRQIIRHVVSQLDVKI